MPVSLEIQSESPTRVIQSAMGTETLPATRFRAGSMRITRPRPKSATQTEPNATVTPFVRPPTRIVLTTLFRFGPILLTVPAFSFVTQTAPAP